MGCAVGGQDFPGLSEFSGGGDIDGEGNGVIDWITGSAPVVQNDIGDGDGHDALGFTRLHLEGKEEIGTVILVVVERDRNGVFSRQKAEHLLFDGGVAGE